MKPDSNNCLESLVTAKDMTPVTKMLHSVGWQEIRLGDGYYADVGFRMSELTTDAKPEACLQLNNANACSISCNISKFKFPEERSSRQQSKVTWPYSTAFESSANLLVPHWVRRGAQRRRFPAVGQSPNTEESERVFGMTFDMVCTQLVGCPVACRSCRSNRSCHGLVRAERPRQCCGEKKRGKEV
jgi:hypothetical protein